jgi:hypothetical protein
MIFCIKDSRTIVTGMVDIGANSFCSFASCVRGKRYSILLLTPAGLVLRSVSRIKIVTKVFCYFRLQCACKAPFFRLQPVRVVPSRNSPIRVHPSIILQPKKEILLKRCYSRWCYKIRHIVASNIGSKHSHQRQRRQLMIGQDSQRNAMGQSARFQNAELERFQSE